ncbi:MAG: Asp23/Gls24 family envelope stress response protein [Hydrogenoanaerobacterium sp.]
MEQKPLRETLGSLKISQEVIATIASAAAKEISGVAGMALCPANIKTFLAKSPSAKSINITITDDIAVIDVYVILKQGAKIPTVSENIQKSVKDAIQTMTGIVVSRVNVFVSGISFDEN